MTARKSRLSTAQLILLNDACVRIAESFGERPYLVGSAEKKDNYRDVDVRSILPDDHFDAIFGGREFFWGLFCMAVSVYLSTVTGLPVDYQVQRMTQANEKFGDLAKTPRNPLGARGRSFAGGGDATNFRSIEANEETT